MKKGNDMKDAMTAGPSLREIGTRWRADAQAEEEAVLAQLLDREQAAEAVAAGQAALPLYAAVEREHGPRLREDQVEFKSPIYARSRWGVDVWSAQQQGADILEQLATNPPAITKQLDEIEHMTIARSGRLRQLVEWLSQNADTGQQLREKVRDYDAAMAILRPRLEREHPDLTPRPTLAAADGVVPPSSPRRAVSGLSDG